MADTYWQECAWGAAWEAAKVKRSFFTEFLQFRQDLFQAAVIAFGEEEQTGFCVRCGTEHDHVEPDGRNYECGCCGQKTVFGAEEIIGMYA